ncbi:ABC transporter permease [Plantactinospora sp. GCM10030261]|uniref:ABC transporter permease n=1 Tax=Plantactinospora sp. GCM10030261 TaxID=3273420 RepID=UPI00361BD5C3
MRPRVVGAIALADFRERVRRPAYLMILLTAVLLGYVAVPAADARWTVVSLGAYRGSYDSAYVGTVTALAGGLWLSLGGFYAIRVAVERDRTSGVGQLLAASPVRTTGYLLGKFTSNLMVLGSMAAMLVLTAGVMQVARGESRTVDPVALVLPYLLLTVPVLAATAAMAVLFETVPVLRAGLGNIVWFLLAMIGLIVAASPAAPLGGLGVRPFAESVRADLAAQRLPVQELGIGLMYLDQPPRPFAWSGLDVTTEFLAQRGALIALAAGLAMLPALWFGRFDPARGRGRTAPGPEGSAPVGSAPGSCGAGPVPVGPAPAPAVPASPPLVPAPAPVVPASPGGPVGGLAGHLPRVMTAPRSGHAFGRVLAGELRVLTRAGSVWWWLGVAVLTVLALVLPLSVATGPMLLATGIWPILLWARLGTQPVAYGVDALFGGYPAIRVRLSAEWTAGLLVTVLVGLGPAARMALAADRAAAVAWAAGCLFVPSLAIACGVLSRTNRLFQVLYLPVWYAIVNDIAAVDVLGALRVDGQPAGPPPLAVVGLAGGLFAVATVVVSIRHARR